MHMNDLKEKIFLADDHKVEKVVVPEWGVTVYVKSLTSRESDAWEESNTVKVGNEYQANRDNMRARYLVRCLVDEEGTRIFVDIDAVELGKKSGAVIDRLWTIAAKLNGVLESSVKDLAKNSENGRKEDSGYSLPEQSSTGR